MRLRLVQLIWIPYLGITFVFDVVCAYIYMAAASIGFFGVSVVWCDNI